MAEQTLTEGQAQTRDEIEAEIAAASERLAASITGLINQAHPRAVMHNTMADARGFFGSEFRQLKSQFVGKDGVRSNRVALAAAAAVGAITFAMIISSIIRRR